MPPKPPAGPGAATPAPEKAEPEEKPAEDAAEKIESKPVPKAAAAADSPSIFYLAVAVITLIFVIGAGVISGVHYLDFEHGLKYADKVPGLPLAK